MNNRLEVLLTLVCLAVVACAHDPGALTTVPPDTETLAFVSVRSGGWWDTCGLAVTGTYCWGSGDSVPSRVRGGMTFSTVEAGGAVPGAGCGLTTGGAPYCWDSCALTLVVLNCPNPADSLPLPVPGGHQFAAITISSHSCGLATNGAVYCWGTNADGELGDGTTGGSEFGPVAVVGGLEFSAIAVGGFHTCGLAIDGSAYCWGANGFNGQYPWEFGGRLGTGDTTNRVIAVPTPVAGGHTFLVISAGGSHDCAVDVAGVAYCWGLNYRTGALGDGTQTNRAMPVAVAADLTFSTLSAGSDFTCGLTSVGEAYCWGNNRLGALGIGSRTGPDNCGTLICSTRPLRVLTDLRFSTISAGGSHVCGLTADGIAYCWGGNSQGELGDARVPNPYCAIIPLAPPAVRGYPYCTVPVKVARQR
jgi:alpha-tubulin suppressor-like RCC1 family protein